MKAQLAELPAELPEKPEGWTAKFVVHFNFGGGRGQSSYAVASPNGLEMPFGMARGSDGAGYALPGVEGLLSWKQLRAVWPRWMERARAKVATREAEAGLPSAQDLDAVAEEQRIREVTRK